MSSDAVMTTLLYVFFGTSSCALVACLFPFGWYHEDTIFSMMHRPEGEPLTHSEGFQPENTPGLSSVMESDPSASKEAIERWETREFGDTGNTPLDETEQFHIVG
jgi:hypothetical protein